MFRGLGAVRSPKAMKNILAAQAGSMRRTFRVTLGPSSPNSATDWQKYCLGRAEESTAISHQKINAIRINVTCHLFAHSLCPARSFWIFLL